jgi:hypothetical protein
MAVPTPTIAPVILDGITPQGHQSYIFCPTVADINNPTAAEITAGTDYKRQIASIDGFAPEGSTVDFPNAGQLTTPNIPGPYSMGTGTVTFNLSKSGSDARSDFNDGTDGVSDPTQGVWYFVPEGVATAGATMRGFSCTLSSANASTDIGAPLTMPTVWSIQEATTWIPVPTA